MSELRAPSDFGRVDPDGTVWVKVGDDERNVGQVPDASPEEALAFYTRRFENLAAEVKLLASRIQAQSMSPQDATKAIDSLRSNVLEANAVGDLLGLVAQLDSLTELLPAQIEARKAARAERNAQTLAQKQRMVEEAEALSQGTDWRGGVDRFRNLLEEWKKLPRIDKTTDNELWRRFSSARTQYTRRRKAHFSELNAKRDDAKVVKQQIIKEAEPLATSTDWGPTSGAFRDLMARWKAAGSARRADDEALWKQFRAIQDQFFDARAEAQAAVDGEEQENLTAKTALVEKVENDLADVNHVEKAKRIHREFLDAFSDVGRVPRRALRDLDNRVRRVAEKVRALEDEEWRRTDPEARQRAEDTVALFQNQVDKLNRDLEAARTAGDERRVKDVTTSLATYQAWLDQANETLTEFSE